MPPSALEPVVMQEEANERPGAAVSFPYDAGLVARFRTAFPRARWRDDRRIWLVPGKLAGRRLHRWLERELSGVLAHADQRGRDAFAFEPIVSTYLEAADDLLVRTPYSKTVVEALRAVPWAWWDGDQRLWRVPFRAFDELRKRWPAIEAAAQRNEPEARKRRAEEARASSEFAQNNALANERRRLRYPVPADALPPMDRPLMSHRGAIVIDDITGELVGAAVATEHYPWSLSSDADLIWAVWRRPSLDELVRTWPSRRPASAADKARGWWSPTIEELRAARRQARSSERSRETRRRHSSIKEGGEA
jgi:hypothetical protein